MVAFEPQSDCYDDLISTYGEHPRFHSEKIALDNNVGEQLIMISNSDTISSLSPAFVDKVSRSGRFSDYHWDLKEMVKTSTLDMALKKYGVPKFIKIDVEGYEYNVISGLHEPVDSLSFEFVPEYLEPALNSIEHLSKLACYEFNYCFGESMTYQSQRGLSPNEIKSILVNIPDKKIFGDIYAIKTK